MQEVTVWATVISAVATSVSAVVIAIQAVLTRRSVEVARKALARSDADSRLALQERLDAQMPFVSIACSEWTEPFRRVGVPNAQSSVTIGNADYDRTDAASESTEITISTWIQVVNDGPGSVDLRWGARFDHAVAGQQRDLIRPGESLPKQIDRTHTVTEWRKYAQRAARGEPTDVVIFEAAYFSPGNVGALDNWEVKSGGSILSPVPSESASADPVHWQITPEASRATSPYPTRPEPQPFTRRYWADRLRNVPLEFGKDRPEDS